MSNARSYTTRIEPNPKWGWNVLLRRSTGEAVLEVELLPLDEALRLTTEAIVRDCQAPGDPVVFCVHGQAARTSKQDKQV